MSEYTREQVKEYLGIACRLGTIPSSDKLIGNPWVRQDKKDYVDFYEKAKTVPEELRDERFNEHLKTLEGVVEWLSSD